MAVCALTLLNSLNVVIGEVACRTRGSYLWRIFWNKFTVAILITGNGGHVWFHDARPSAAPHDLIDFQLLLSSSTVWHRHTLCAHRDKLAVLGGARRSIEDARPFTADEVWRTATLGFTILSGDCHILRALFLTNLRTPAGTSHDATH